MAGEGAGGWGSRGEVHDKHHERGGATQRSGPTRPRPTFRAQRAEQNVETGPSGHGRPGAGRPGAIGPGAGRAPDHAQVAMRPPASSTRFLEGKLQVRQVAFPGSLRPRRVTGLLDEAAGNRVTLNFGPAGPGKTVAAGTSAAAPAQARPGCLAHPGRRGPARSSFSAHVCAGLARLRSSPAQSLRSLEDVIAGRSPLRSSKVRPQTFTNQSSSCWMIIHELDRRIRAGGIDLLIRHAPASLRLVLSARQPPALQLARLRVAGELADIGGHDLACTSEEADAYFSMLGLDVAPSARDAPPRRTQASMARLRWPPWPPGRPGTGRHHTDLAGDQPYRDRLPWDEVLVKQAPATACSSCDLHRRSGVRRSRRRADRQSGIARTGPAQPGEQLRGRARPRARRVRLPPAAAPGPHRRLHREIPHEVPVLLRPARAGTRPMITRSPRSLHGRGAGLDYAAQTLAEAGRIGQPRLDRGPGKRAVPVPSGPLVRRPRRRGGVGRGPAVGR